MSHVRRCAILGFNLGKRRKFISCYLVKMAATTRTIPEVQLKYSEFLWALGKLKYKDYGKKMQERLLWKAY